jgi:uncharacterized membrane protein YhaH (DUF805 family)
MGFGQAIATCFGKYASFNGRASLAEYWWWFLFRLLVLVPAFGVDIGVFHSRFPVFALIAIFVLFLPSLAVAVRRLHDINCAGWWFFLVFIPFGSIILLIMACIPGTVGENDYDRQWW